MNKSRGTADKRVSQLPNWLWSSSNVLPSMYKRIWEAVREERLHLGANQGELLVDTKKVFPLLLTSHLPTEVLGYIWGLANQKYAGKLTEQELYVVLALVAVAQTSYSFTNLEVLHLLPGPPEPRLNLALICPNVGQIPPPRDTPVCSNDFAVKREIQVRSLQKINPGASGIVIPGLVPDHSHLGETKIDSKTRIVDATTFPRANDDPIPEPGGAGSFETDGKTSIAHSSLSADSSDDFSDFQSAPAPQTSPSIPILDAKLGSAIGSRLANHNLGVKKTGDKQKKIFSGVGSVGKIHGSSRGVSSAAEKTTESPGPTGGKESLRCVERSGELFPKCAPKNQAKTVILKDTAIRSNDSPKLPRETNDIGDKIEISPPSRQISGKFVAPASPRYHESSPQDLMNLQQVEDKYSALRVLVEEPKLAEANPIVDAIAATSALSQSDDFGDFVSAERQPESTDASSSTINATSSINDNDDTSDFFSDFERFRSTISANKEADDSSNAVTTVETFGNLETRESPDGQSLDEKYDGIIETVLKNAAEKIISKEDTISVSSVELGNCTTSVMTRSSSVPSLDLKSFLSPSADDEQQSVENTHQLIYWEWKRYMESCVFLLQTAANVFGSITSDEILQEVMSSAQGYNFLCNLAEVAAVCRRVNFSHKEMDINIMGFDDLLMDIDRIWAEMEPFYANIPIVTELPVWPLHRSESSACCALCLTVVTSGRIVYNDNNYHVTCANLWLNCVNRNLPTLRYPASSFVSHSIPIISAGSGQI